MHTPRKKQDHYRSSRDEEEYDTALNFHFVTMEVVAVQRTDGRRLVAGAIAASRHA